MQLDIHDPLSTYEGMTPFSMMDEPEEDYGDVFLALDGLDIPDDLDDDGLFANPYLDDEDDFDDDDDEDEEDDELVYDDEF